MSVTRPCAIILDDFCFIVALIFGDTGERRAATTGETNTGLLLKKSSYYDNEDCTGGHGSPGIL